MFSTASVCRFVCLWVCLFVSTITSKRVKNIGWWNLGDRCITQKSQPSLNLGVLAPRGAHPTKCGIQLRRWENQCTLSSVNNANEHLTSITHTCNCCGHHKCRQMSLVSPVAVLDSVVFVDPRKRGKRYVACSFHVARPSVWNNLPPHLHSDDISHKQFTRDFKTFLFAQACLSEAPLRTAV